MKYKEYNKIIKAYKEMEQQLLREGNTHAANACKIIIEDLELLLKQGVLGQFPREKENK